MSYAIKIIIDALDKLWASLIKARDKKCVMCGQTNALESAHIFGRVKMSVRWLLYNGLTLCTDCHKWSHSNPAKFQLFARHYIGIQIYDALKERARTIIKVDREFLEKTKEELDKFQNGTETTK